LACARFIFTCPSTTSIYPLSLHDALPICEAIKLPLTDQASLDHIAQYIWDNQGTQDGHFADSLAWLCKVLRNSKHGRYKAVLDPLAQKPIHKKITRYAAKTAKQLSSSTPVFTPAIKTQTANTAQDAKL